MEDSNATDRSTCCSHACGTRTTAPDDRCIEEEAQPRKLAHSIPSKSWRGRTSTWHATHMFLLFRLLIDFLILFSSSISTRTGASPVHFFSFFKIGSSTGLSASINAYNTQKKVHFSSSNFHESSHFVLTLFFGSKLSLNLQNSSLSRFFGFYVDNGLLKKNQTAQIGTEPGQNSRPSSTCLPQLNM